MDSNTESHRLAEWSNAIRESSLKRLRIVPEAHVNWRPTPESMSFADLAHHLVEADVWLFEKLNTPDLAPMVGRAGAVGSVTPAGYQAILSHLQATGIERFGLIQSLTPERLSAAMPDARFGGAVSVWWVLVRGNLDHEVHHRGQVAAYLRFLSHEATKSAGA